MFALRERRVHVTQEDFEMAVAKVTISRDHPRQQVGFRIVIVSMMCVRVCVCLSLQIMLRDSEKNMSIKQQWK